MGAIYGLHAGDYKFRYIGLTTNTIENRLNEHKRLASTEPRTAVQHWIRKIGINNVRTALIEECGNELLSDAEIKWIAILDTFKGHNPQGLNLTLGGHQGIGWKWTDDIRDRRRISLDKYWSNPDNRRASGDKSRGRKHTDQARANMSSARVGIKFSEQHIANIGASSRGRIFSQETRNRMSEARTGVAFTEERKKNLSEAAKAQNGKSQHTRWHTNRKVINPACQHCASEA